MVSDCRYELGERRETLIKITTRVFFCEDGHPESKQ